MPDGLLERLRRAADDGLADVVAAEPPAPCPRPFEIVAEWLRSLDARPGACVTPSPSQLAPVAQAWAAGRGWDVLLEPRQVGNALRTYGLRQQQQGRGSTLVRGYGTTRQAADALWAAVGGRPTARTARVSGDPGRKRQGVALDSRPLLRDALGSALGVRSQPVVDSDGGVWPSATMAERMLGLATGRVLHVLGGRRTATAGRLWRRVRMPRAALIALVPPDARVGQPGVLCWCSCREHRAGEGG